MCGFVVTTEANKADEMLDRQAFRGPDARGETIRYITNLTFGHVLLDISGEKFTSNNGSLSIAEER